MKKIAIVLGVAAVATFTGCRDQEYDAKHGKQVQDEPKSIVTTPTKSVHVAQTTPVRAAQEIQVVERSHCTCAPGTKHAAPCTCGASDCKCVVVKPQQTTVATSEQPAAEYTTYIVQNGDYLAKISKKYNVTINAIKRLNDLKDDKIRVGQKLKLPGKIDVGVQAVPEKPATKVTAKKGYVPYTGATKEYVVKSGDTLGSVAYGNGINIRQLKELNKLTNDTLKVGQKLKIPAEKVVAAKPTVKADAAVAAKPPVAKKTVTKIETPAVSVPSTPVQKEEAKTPAVESPAPAPAESAVAEVVTPAPAVAATSTYVVQPGEDITRLAVDFGVTPTVIRELNNMGENDQVKPGQVLKIPAESQQ